MAEMHRLRNEMDRLFGRYGSGRSPRQFGMSVFPPVNLWEDDDNLYVEAELPGFELDELEIYVTGGNQLSVKGERKQPELTNGSWHRQERGFGNFSRMIELPSDVDCDKVSAEFKHGVLTIKLAKSEAVKPRRIEVKAN
jgi:HSP20 family protein